MIKIIYTEISHYCYLQMKENALRGIETTREVIVTFVKRELAFHVRISEKRA